MNVERFADRLDQVAAECEDLAEMHASLVAPYLPDWLTRQLRANADHEADNALLLEAIVLRVVAAAARAAT